jgi:hypothetical protein
VKRLVAGNAGKSDQFELDARSSSPKEQEDGFMSPRRHSKLSPRGVSTFHAVEFSKTTPAQTVLVLRQQKTSDSHQRPSGSEQRRSYPLARRLLLVELQAFSTLLAEGLTMVAHEISLSTKPFAGWTVSP